MGPMARPSLLDNEPALAQTIADAYMDGMTNQEIADLLGRGVHKDTITDYKRDPRVRNRIKAISDEREGQISRTIDKALLERAKHPEKLDTKTLLEIKKTLNPKRIEITDGSKQSDLVEELWRAADGDPVLAEKLMTLGLEKTEV